MQKKMTKKQAWIGAISIMLVWFAIWGLAYWYLGNQVNKANTNGFANEARNYLVSNAEFTEKYGKLTDMISHDKEPITLSEKESYMDFICTTMKDGVQGEVTVRVIAQVLDGKQWEMRYQELPAE